MTPRACTCVFFFLGYSRVRSGIGLRRELDGRLEEWPIPDTRVDLTLLYLINYSVRYPILQFVPSHIFSSPLHTAVPQRCSSPPPRSTESLFFFLFRSTNRRSIESRVCAICVNVNRNRSSIYLAKNKVYLDRREENRK